MPGVLKKDHWEASSRSRLRARAVEKVGKVREGQVMESLIGHRDFSSLVSWGAGSPCRA